MPVPCVECGAKLPWVGAPCRACVARTTDPAPGPSVFAAAAGPAPASPAPAPAAPEPTLAADDDARVPWSIPIRGPEPVAAVSPGGPDVDPPDHGPYDDDDDPFGMDDLEPWHRRRPVLATASLGLLAIAGLLVAGALLGGSPSVRDRTAASAEPEMAVADDESTDVLAGEAVNPDTGTPALDDPTPDPTTPTTTDPAGDTDGDNDGGPVDDGGEPARGDGSSTSGGGTSSAVAPTTTRPVAVGSPGAGPQSDGGRPDGVPWLATSFPGGWVAQLSSLPTAEGEDRLRDAVATLRRTVDGAVATSTADWDTLRPGYWVLVHPGPFADAAAVEAFCADAGLGADDCLPRELR